MRIKAEDLNHPILLGYPVNNNKQLAVWCPYCVQYHFHGNVEGHRNAHCERNNSPFNTTGYIIKRANKTQLNFHNGSIKNIDNAIMKENK